MIDTEAPATRVVAVNIPTEAFLRGVNSVLACADTDRTMPALNAVNIAWDHEGYVFAATDRYVLGEHTIAAPDGDRYAGNISVPLDTLKSALAVIKATSPGVVNLSGESPRFTLLAAIMGIEFEPAGEFPRYRPLFPPSEDYSEIGACAFSPSKVAQLAGPKVKLGRGPARVRDMRFTFAKPSKPGMSRPITVHRLGDDEFRGILMPVRAAS